MEIQIRCQYEKLMPIDELKTKTHPRNRNKHPREQIERIKKIFAYQGIRRPAVISNLSGKMTTWHGRLVAAEEMGMKLIPVTYQDYDNEDQEYADLTADNAIASWAEIDYAGVNSDLEILGPDFDLDCLGMRNFMLDPADKQNYEDEWKGMPEFKQEENMGFHTLKVHFADEDALNKFRELVNQPITNKTKSIWYPALERENFKETAYVSE